MPLYLQTYKYHGYQKVCLSHSCLVFSFVFPYFIFCSVAHFDQWHTSKCEQKPQSPCVGGHALSCAQNLEAMTLWKSPNESAGEWGASLEKNWDALANPQPKGRSWLGPLWTIRPPSGLQRTAGTWVSPAENRKQASQPRQKTCPAHPQNHRLHTWISLQASKRWECFLCSKR